MLALASIATLAPPRPERLSPRWRPPTIGWPIGSRHFGDTLQVTRVAGVPAAAGQVHELWMIAPDASPVSLGLAAKTDRWSITYPTPPAGFTFAVSVEPEGGSPTGQPTGPVILTAIVSRTPDHEAVSRSGR